jgi:hypothetical protein
MAKIALNWTKLLGFDQVPADCEGVLANAAKVGDRGGNPAATTINRDLALSSGQIITVLVGGIS